MAGRELKLGPGGLRDIEFAVQLLQLVHGRDDDRLRVPATLPALAALADGGYVGRADADDLAQAYRFLRQTEHLLQLTSCAAPTRCRPTRRCCAGSAARSVGSKPIIPNVRVVPPDPRPLRARPDGGPAGGGVHRGVDQDRAAGAPPAREALLPAAARRGRQAAVRARPGSPRRRPAPASRRSATATRRARCGTSRR